MNDLLKLFSKPDLSRITRIIKPIAPEPEEPKSKILKKVCSVCGKDFQTKKADKETCSRVCQKKSKPSKTKYCMVCGIELKNVGSRKTCSDKCYRIQLTRRDNGRGKGPTYRNCICCGKPFLVERFSINRKLSKRTTCGIDCNNELLRRLTIERRAKK